MRISQPTGGTGHQLLETIHTDTFGTLVAGAIQGTDSATGFPIIHYAGVAVGCQPPDVCGTNAEGDSIDHGFVTAGTGLGACS